MEFDNAAPCRHRGTPSIDLVDQVANLLEKVLADDEEYLKKNGISQEEFRRAFPSAVEKIRGSWAASNKDRRNFTELVIKHLAESGGIKGYDVPKYGDSTVYRLILQDGKRIGIIQKGCPDGAHSSTKWERPDWADELYLWWLCSSQKYQPGQHIWKGVSRLRKKIEREEKNQLDGIIFFNSLCGTSERPCPKTERIEIGSGLNMPPPCVYVLPEWDRHNSELNWRGTVSRFFPKVLLEAFNINSNRSNSYVGYVGFQKKSDKIRIEITSKFGVAKTLSVRG